MDMTGEECLACNEPCIEKMFGCSGLPQVIDETVTDPTLPDMINPGEASTDSPTSSGDEDETNAPTSSPGDSETFTFAPVNPSPTQPTDRDNSGASGNNQLIALSLVVLGMMIV